jgi:hypothetical protein
METRVLSHDNSCDIFGGKIVTGTGLSIKYICFSMSTTILPIIHVRRCTGHTQKNGAVSFLILLKPHHSFVYALYLSTIGLCSSVTDVFAK